MNDSISTLACLRILPLNNSFPVVVWLSWFRFIWGMVGNVSVACGKWWKPQLEISKRHYFCPFAFYPSPPLHTHLASSCHLFQTNEQYLLISIPCQALKLLFKELLWLTNSSHLYIEGGIRGSLTWVGFSHYSCVITDFLRLRSHLPSRSCCVKRVCSGFHTFW